MELILITLPVSIWLHRILQPQLKDIKKRSKYYFALLCTLLIFDFIGSPSTSIAGMVTWRLYVYTLVKGYYRCWGNSRPAELIMDNFGAGRIRLAQVYTHCCSCKSAVGSRAQGGGSMWHRMKGISLFSFFSRWSFEHCFCSAFFGTGNTQQHEAFVHSKLRHSQWGVMEKGSFSTVIS